MNENGNGTTNGIRTRRKQYYSPPNIPSMYKCIECQISLCSKNHFIKFLQCCTDCTYSTRCDVAYNLHTRGHKICGKSYKNYGLYRRHEVLTDEIMKCSCGFETRLGNKFALHATKCSSTDNLTLIVPSTSGCKNSMQSYLPKQVQQALSLTFCPRNEVKLENSGQEDTETKGVSTLNSSATDNAGNMKNVCHTSKHGRTLDYFYKCHHRDNRATSIAQKVDTICKHYDLQEILPLQNDTLRKIVLVKKCRDPAPMAILPRDVRQFWKQVLAKGSSDDDDPASSETSSMKNSDDACSDYNYRLSENASLLNVLPMS